jgi:hypothetical protein
MKRTPLHLTSRIQHFQSAFNLNGGALQNGAYHHKENTGYGKDYYQGTYFAGALLETVSQQSALFSVDYQAVCRKCQSEIIKSLIVYKSIL